MNSLRQRKRSNVHRHSATQSIIALTSASSINKWAALLSTKTYTISEVIHVSVLKISVRFGFSDVWAHQEYTAFFWQIYLDSSNLSSSLHRKKISGVRCLEVTSPRDLSWKTGECPEPFIALYPLYCLHKVQKNGTPLVNYRSASCSGEDDIRVRIVPLQIETSRYKMYSKQTA